MSYFFNNYISALFVFFIVAFIYAESVNSKMTSWEKQPVHRYIISEDDWLNTSRSIRAGDLKGRIILLNFWTYSDIGSLHGVADLQDIQREFGNKVAVIGVHSGKFTNEEDIDNVRDAVIKYGIKYPVVNDPKSRIWHKFGVSSWPSFLLIGPDGEVYSHYFGEENNDDIGRDIGELIYMFGEDLVPPKFPIELEIDKNPHSGYLKYPSKLEYVADFEGEPALFISDTGHNRIVGVRLNGEVFIEIGSKKSGLKNGAFETAEFKLPNGVLYNEGVLYIADTNNHIIRAANFEKREVITVAGKGFRGYDLNVEYSRALGVEMASPWDFAQYPNENNIVISMAGLHQIWEYDIEEKKVTAIAGSGKESMKDGEFPNNTLGQPSGLFVDGEKLYFIDAETSSLRVFSEGNVTTMLGQGLNKFGYYTGRVNRALMQHPLAVYVDGQQAYIADTYNHAIRQYDIKNDFLRDYAGNNEKGDQIGTLEDARFNAPSDIIKIGNLLYVADTNNHKIKTIDMDKEIVEDFYVIPFGAVMVPETPREESELPNVVKGDMAAPSYSEVKVIPNKDWKIYKNSSSWIVVFKDGKYERGFVSNEFISDIPLALSFEEGHKYRLQGTLYYCRADNEDVCEEKSFDIAIKFSSESENAVINLNLKK